MTVDEKLDLLINEMSDMKSEISDMKSEISDMKESIDTLRRAAAVTETDIAPKVQILLENHTDLAQNVNVAKDVDSRVGVLEFEMKVVKGILDSIRSKIV